MAKGPSETMGRYIFYTPFQGNHSSLYNVNYGWYRVLNVNLAIWGSWATGAQWKQRFWMDAIDDLFDNKLNISSHNIIF